MAEATSDHNQTNFASPTEEAKYWREKVSNPVQRNYMGGNTYF